MTDYLPYTARTARLLDELAGFDPRTLAIMHGSTFEGDGARALRLLAPTLKDVFSAAEEEAIRPA